jgi:hypothetical protein
VSNPENEKLYVGEPWELEIKATDTKSGEPVEPPSLSVVVYPPGARETPPTRESIGPVTLPKLSTNVYEDVVVEEVNEEGQWLAVVTSPAPLKAVLPVAQWVSIVPVMPS